MTRIPHLKWVVGALLLSATISGQSSSPAPVGNKSAPGPATRARFLEMFARGYFPGRSGQLMIVPRQGDIITRDEPSIQFMHGSPWPYDVNIPMLFVGAQIRPGVYPNPARHQDIAATLAAALGTSMPRSATGRALPILTAGVPAPRAVAVIVLDGMRLDYFTQHAAEMPTLNELRKQGAWFTNARIDYLPTNTAVAHTTISTGTDPRVHGITGNNLYDRVKRQRRDSYAGWDPGDLMALTLADVWQLENRGHPVVIALGASVPAATALAGHGACQLNGVPTILAGYDERSGRWGTNANCFRPIDSLKDMAAESVWPSDGLWMGRKIDTPSAIRRSALFPTFEADALVQLIETSNIGKDGVTDLVLVNYKAADYVGHQHGPGSEELRVTLGEMDRNLVRILAALEAKVGKNYMLAITADHGMPGEPPEPGRRHYSAAIVERVHAVFDPHEKKLITYYEPENGQIFVDVDRLITVGLTLRDLMEFLESEPYIFAVFTEDQVRRTAASLR